MQKKCSKCLETKAISEFHKTKNGQYGVHAWCKVCKRYADNLRYEQQGKNKPIDMSEEAVLRRRENRARWYKNNRDQANKSSHAAAKKNPNTKIVTNKRLKHRYDTDQNYRIKIRIRAMLARVARKVKSAGLSIERREATFSVDQLRDRISCQFKPGMSWENHGAWHIDHKKPIAAFIRQGITDASTINMLCNLQPMWAPDNQRKSAKWEGARPANDNVAGSLRRMAA